MKAPPKVGAVKGNLRILVVTQNRSGWTCLCACSCGEVLELQASRISGYRSRYASCNIKGHRFVKVRHGWSRRGKLRSPEHIVWVGMHQRCENPNDQAFVDYGGRGIRVCSRWAVFENFLADMGPRPRGMTLDRRDNDGNYEPGNCRWSTRKTQANNRRSSHFVAFAGKTQTIAAWSDETGLTQSAIRQRLAAGWSVAKTVTTQPMKNKYAYK